jgi:hypothetical protein
MPGVISRTVDPSGCRNPKGLAILAALLTVWTIIAAGLRPVPIAADDGDHRAALIVRSADGDVQTRCVSFSEPSLSGEQLLTRSGLAATIDYNAGLGGAVCSINGQGCDYPVQNCFCRCTGAACEYWAYYLWSGAAWQYSPLGASSVNVSDGALQGWSWGPGDFASATEPPQIPFAEICKDAAAATGQISQSSAPTAFSLYSGQAFSLEGLSPKVVSESRQPDISQYVAFVLIAGLMLGAGAIVMCRQRTSLSANLSNNQDLKPEATPPA